MSYFKCPKCGKNLNPVWSSKWGKTHACEWNSGDGCGYSVPSKEIYAKSKKAVSITACKQRLREALTAASDSPTVWYAYIDVQDIVSLIGGTLVDGKYTPPKEKKNAPKL